LARKNKTNQKIERGEGLEVAKEGDITNGDDEYNFGNNGNDAPLAEGDKDEDDKYSKDGNIADDNNKYAVGNDSVKEPLAKGNNDYDTLSAARV
jgi:hypothetical protein